MSKFINKKEQVFDIQLTPYGRHLMSLGKFQPAYYAFFDDNILYDGNYAGITETQSEIGQRIKKDTQYLEGLVLFENVEDVLTNTNPPMTEGGAENFFLTDVSPIQITPKKDSYRYTSMIGDANLDGEQQIAPAWKVVTLNGKITSSDLSDGKNDIKIPQVNIKLNYEKIITDSDTSIDMREEHLRKAIARTKPFSDDKLIELISDDLLVYVEELNTDMLTENFDIEIFEIDTDGAMLGTETDPRDAFRRKYFKEDHQRIMGSLITEKSLNAFDPIDDDVRNIDFNYTTSSVGYYFDVIRDHQIDPAIACKSAEVFNRESYYVDLDFKCSDLTEHTNYYIDLYGPVTEPEICP
jgi:hypothetical protein